MCHAMAKPDGTASAGEDREGLFSHVMSNFFPSFPLFYPCFFASVEEKHMHGLFGRPLLQVGNQVH